MQITNKDILKKKGLINFENEDNESLRWCHIRSLLHKAQCNTPSDLCVMDKQTKKPYNLRLKNKFTVTDVNFHKLVLLDTSL